MPQRLKPEYLRRGHHAPAVTRAILPFEEPRTRTPRLPDGLRDWRPETRAWWCSVWASDAAESFMRLDVWGLVIMAVLVDQFHTEPSTALAAEIRLWEAKYGLTPLARMRLGLAAMR